MYFQSIPSPQEGTWSPWAVPPPDSWQNPSLHPPWPCFQGEILLCAGPRDLLLVCMWCLETCCVCTYIHTCVCMCVNPAEERPLWSPGGHGDLALVSAGLAGPGGVTEKEGEHGLCQAVGGRAPCPPHRGAQGLGAVGWPLQQPGGPQEGQGLLVCTR